MASVFLEMTVGVLGITRIIRNEAQPANKGNVDLTAMGMACKRQCNAGRHVCEDVGLVSEQNDRRAICDMAQGCFQVPDAPAFRVKLIVKPCDPKVIAPPAHL